jgi:large subunit ribosomal protein L13
MERKTHTIDATGRILGRLAVEISLLLRGKAKPDFVANQDKGDFVLVKNVAKMKFSGKKLEQRKYFSHSKYLGSSKFTPLSKVFETNPSEVLKRAVYGMLPVNRTRAEQIKRLKFE